MSELEDLLRKCKKGNANSQRILFDRMKSKWMGICIRYMKDPDSAKDVFQEAALKILSDLHQLKELPAFMGWARKIVVNTSLNHLKKRQSYLFALQEHHAGENAVPVTGDDEIIAKMDHAKLLEIINSMPEGYRMVFNMFLIDGYSHQEIAVSLRISESTSRSQLSKARQFLKRILETLKKSSHENVVGF